MLGLSRHAAVFRSMTSVMAVATMAVTAPAFAQQVRNFDIPAQAASKGVPQFAKQAGIQILANGNTLRGKRTNAVRGAMPVDSALRTLLSGTGLVMRDGVDGSGIKTIVEAPRQNSAAPAPVAMTEAAQEARAPAYDEIIVTAQKKEERISDVPIAMSAFSAEALDELKIEGGAELLRSVPNVVFSKTNFASYNFSIRGIGTKALSVSSDPAVAISFNYVPLIRNRLFEQEYLDVERVEVLRGPQGTLYGRNATGGVVNMLPNRPEFDEFALKLKGETGNYQSRRMSGSINMPLSDRVAVRAAGSFTKRQGYDFNTATGQRVNGRDLWSTRLSLSVEPVDDVRLDFIWERFNEDDDRSRTGKQLCTKDEGPSSFAGRDLTNLLLVRGALSQGCLPKSLFTDAAYSVPNAFSLPYIAAAAELVQIGRLPGTSPSRPLQRVISSTTDPYQNIVVSKNLREISTLLNPDFKAKNDIFQFNIEIYKNRPVSFNFSSSYSQDYYYSFQDYNRFNSGDVFQDSSIMTAPRGGPLPTTGISVGGMLDDPQLGKSSKILAADTVKSKSDQWYIELRSVSNFDGKFNYNSGANYLKFNIEEDYFVFSNLFTALARTALGTGNNGSVVQKCDNWTGVNECTYVDPSPLSDLDGDGHNYFRSRNIGSTSSKSIFFEGYYNITDNLKATAGLRYTDDKKKSVQYPTQLLLGTGTFGSGLINRGYFRDPDINQRWKRLTGRFVLDWKPDFDFTDDSLVYASYARGYKGGGANPPRIGVDLDALNFYVNEQTFQPETVNAFELGTKNVFLNGRASVSLTGFFYDYDNYQISQITDRIALNENFDATMYGVEVETKFKLSPRLTMSSNFGYLKTRIKDGEGSIDVMDRTQGNPDWVVLKPWVQMASNCIAPRALVEQVLSSPLTTDVTGIPALTSAFCPGRVQYDYLPGGIFANQYGFTYNPRTDAPNFGRGFDAPLGGNELPNSPRWTFNLAASYVVPLNGWSLTFSGDYYRQAASWARVYNTEIDHLKSWSNINSAVTLSKDDGRIEFQLYVKNVLNDTPITDMHLNSDDSGLTSNVFTLDPRIIGFNTVVKF